MSSFPNSPPFMGAAVGARVARHGSLMLLLLAVSAPAFAAGTIAGTDIQNIASATFDTASGPVTIDSNSVVIKVDELLDVTVVKNDPGDVLTSPGKTGTVQSFRITNSGNGDEAFALTVTTSNGGDDFDPALQQVVLDTNNNNVYDAGVDVPYVAGSNDPVLAPDQSKTIFVITSTPLGIPNGARAIVSLAAAAVTGTGVPGTSFAGQGQGGANAVVGSTGASSTDNSFLAVQSASLTLAKSATVFDPFGGQRTVPGAVVTYRLIATVSGAGVLNNVTITDPIPTGSAYQTESMTIQSSAAPAMALTDAADADAGAFNGARISVATGNIPAGETRTVTFRVVIQ